MPETPSLDFIRPPPSLRLFSDRADCCVCVRARVRLMRTHSVLGERRRCQHCGDEYWTRENTGLWRCSRHVGYLQATTGTMSCCGVCPDLQARALSAGRDPRALPVTPSREAMRGCVPCDHDVDPLSDALPDRIGIVRLYSPLVGRVREEALFHCPPVAPRASTLMMTLDEQAAAYAKCGLPHDDVKELLRLAKVLALADPAFYTWLEGYASDPTMLPRGLVNPTEKAIKVWLRQLLNDPAIRDTAGEFTKRVKQHAGLVTSMHDYDTVWHLREIATTIAAAPLELRDAVARASESFVDGPRTDPLRAPVVLVRRRATAMAPGVAAEQLALWRVAMDSLGGADAIAPLPQHIYARLPPF